MGKLNAAVAKYFGVPDVGTFGASVQDRVQKRARVPGMGLEVGLDGIDGEDHRSIRNLKWVCGCIHEGTGTLGIWWGLIGTI